MWEGHRQNQRIAVALGENPEHKNLQENLLQNYCGSFQLNFSEKKSTSFFGKKRRFPALSKGERHKKTNRKKTENKRKTGKFSMKTPREKREIGTACAQQNATVTFPEAPPGPLKNPQKRKANVTQKVFSKTQRPRR